LAGGSLPTQTQTPPPPPPLAYLGKALPATKTEEILREKEGRRLL
jgi:hypothetical protein